MSQPDGDDRGVAKSGANQAAADSPDVGRQRRAAHAEQRRTLHVATADWRSIRGFSIGQRRALILVLTVFLICIAVGLLRNPTHVDDPLPADAMRFNELADRIDPNVVDAAMLSALPNLGERRARDIIDYRDRLRAVDPNRVVFKTVDDLLRVKGIGYTISRQMEPYLTFSATRPATNAVANDG